jgi:hypothetical protein
MDDEDHIGLLLALLITFIAFVALTAVAIILSVVGCH